MTKILKPAVYIVLVMLIICFFTQDLIAQKIPAKKNQKQSVKMTRPAKQVKQTEPVQQADEYIAIDENIVFVRDHWIYLLSKGKTEPVKIVQG